ncbi:MAG TPA: PTS sugar transporter subunit IIA [Phycisphaerales bacterium]|nr:PTS sugar transporter subunit IIA [Phycisphaerales bacterium]
MRLEPLLRPENVQIVEAAASRDHLLSRLAERAHAEFPSIPGDRLLNELIDREKKYPTSVPEGVAFPHAILPDIDHTLIVAYLCKPAVNFGVKGHAPTALVFGMFANADEPWQHVRTLARLARITHAPGALDRIRSASDAAVLFDLLIAEDRRHG